MASTHILFTPKVPVLITAFSDSHNSRMVYPYTNRYKIDEQVFIPFVKKIEVDKLQYFGDNHKPSDDSWMVYPYTNRYKIHDQIFTPFIKKIGIDKLQHFGDVIVTEFQGGVPIDCPSDLRAILFYKGNSNRGKSFYSPVIDFPSINCKIIEFGPSSN